MDNAIAIGVAAADLAGLNAAPDTAMGLHGEVFQEQSIHRAFETDVKLVDLAFGQSEDADARKAQALEDAGDILLVSADAVQRLGQHHVEAAGLRIGQQRLDAGTNERCAGDGAVGIGFHDGPALADGALPALAQLVLDGSVTLVVGGIAGVERNAGHRRFLSFLVGLVLRFLGHDGPVVVGGVQPFKIFPRHAAADDAGQRQRGVVDALQRRDVRQAARIVIVVVPERSGLVLCRSRFPCRCLLTNEDKQA